MKEIKNQLAIIIELLVEMNIHLRVLRQIAEESPQKLEEGR